jgi:diguanylate cyclase (GGDEF)-like protein
MHARFKGGGPVFGLLIGGTTVLAAISYGWWLVALPVFASAVMAGAVVLHPRTSRPEVLAMITFGLLELDLAVTVLFTGGGASPLLSLMVVPIFTQAVSFRPHVTRAWVTLSAVLTVAVVAGATRLDRDPVVASPTLQAVGYLALLGSIALAAHYLTDAEVNSRGKAVVDELTGLFNRKALRGHFSDIRAQALLTGDPFAVVMIDIDHFKAINDSHGHHRGDVVLQKVAECLRVNLRSRNLIYRIGGEEFLVLMPGHTLLQASQAAERLREAVAADELAGVAVTISAGLTCAAGPAIEYGTMLHAADKALYRAKANGRNQIWLAPEGQPAPAEPGLAFHSSRPAGEGWSAEEA